MINLDKPNKAQLQMLTDGMEIFVGVLGNVVDGVSEPSSRRVFPSKEIHSSGSGCLLSLRVVKTTLSPSLVIFRLSNPNRKKRFIMDNSSHFNWQKNRPQIAMLFTPLSFLEKESRAFSFPPQSCASTHRNDAS